MKDRQIEEEEKSRPDRRSFKQKNLAERFKTAIGKSGTIYEANPESEIDYSEDDDGNAQMNFKKLSVARNCEDDEIVNDFEKYLDAIESDNQDSDLTK